MKTAYLLVHHVAWNESKIIGCYTNPELRDRVRAGMLAAFPADSTEDLEDVDIPMEGE